MADLLLFEYPATPQNVILESLVEGVEHQEEYNFEEENWMLQVQY